jgi:hypothetical protein
LISLQLSAANGAFHLFSWAQTNPVSGYGRGASEAGKYGGKTVIRKSKWDIVRSLCRATQSSADKIP